MNYLVHELFEFISVHDSGWQFMNFMNVSFVVQEHSWIVHKDILRMFMNVHQLSGSLMFWAHCHSWTSLGSWMMSVHDRSWTIHVHEQNKSPWTDEQNTFMNSRTFMKISFVVQKYPLTWWLTFMNVHSVLLTNIHELFMNVNEQFMVISPGRASFNCHGFPTNKDVETMLGSSWPTVYDAGPILIQHWSCACCVMTDMVIDKKVYFAIKLLFTGKCVGDMYI